MTDSSSKDDLMGDMAAELMQAKMDSARKDTQMTHVLRIGTFHMELVPDDNIDVNSIFQETLDKLMERYDKDLLTINIQQMNESSGKLAHYG
tara:strand:+ start:679 stop:954 length:276 start_codon:yes stop_codon:yes gene_type:complete